MERERGKEKDRYGWKIEKRKKQYEEGIVFVYGQKSDINGS